MTKLTILIFTIICIIQQGVASEAGVNSKLNESNAPDNIVESSLENRDVKVFNDGKYFGLKDENGSILIKPEYTKLIMVGKTGWIIQKRGKFGLINSNGDILIEPKFRHVDRLLGRFVKIGNENDFGIYNIADHY